jgi:hypothetical protein
VTIRLTYISNKLDFTKCKSKYGVYVQAVASDITLIYLYVDDLLVTANNINNMKKFTQLMIKGFEMRHLGNLSHFLGMELIRTEKGIILHQRKYAREVLKMFIMFESNSATSPVKENLKLEKRGEEEKVHATLFKHIIGSLRYLCNSRPDIGFSVGLVSRYMDDPIISHMKVTRRILKYLNATINYGFFLPTSLEDNDVVITC